MRSRLLDPFEFRLMGELRSLLSHCNTEEMMTGPIVLQALVSGGRDSMALIHALKRISDSDLFQERGSCQIRVLHFNHVTRDGESCRDAQFVRQYCLDSGLPVQIITRATPFAQDINRTNSFQALASNWRRQCCKQIRETIGKRILFLTAHHAGDQAESLILNLVRGVGLQGLSGMHPFDPASRFCKPLLGFASTEIQQYVDKQNVKHIEDSSNAISKYSRNFVRLEVIPALRKLNPDVEKALVNLANEARESRDNSKPLPKNLSLFLWSKNNSTSLLSRWIRQHHRELMRQISRQSLKNLAHHLDHWAKQGVKSGEGMTPFVPLGYGWVAKLKGQEVEIVAEHLSTRNKPSSRKSPDSRLLGAGRFATSMGRAYDSPVDV